MKMFNQYEKYLKRINFARPEQKNLKSNLNNIKINLENFLKKFAPDKHENNQNNLVNPKSQKEINFALNRINKI